jgi:hypothetical protein
MAIWDFFCLMAKGRRMISKAKAKKNKPKK